jgi:hypothetical protein
MALTLPKFQQDGTGAVNRDFTDKLKEFVSVKDFGAVGDGVTDDTAAFQTASITGKPFYVPTGDYRLTSGFSLSSGQRMYGDGPAKSTLIVDGDFNVVTLASDYASVEGVKILSNTQRSSGAFIYLSSATRGNDIINFVLYAPYIGIHIDSESVVTNIHDGEIINCTPSTGVGIHLNGGNDTFISKIVIDNPEIAQPAYGFYIHRTQAIWVSDSDILHCNVGVGFNPNGLNNGYVTWCFFNQVAFDNGASNGIQFFPSNAAIVRGVFFDNCWSSSNNRGVYIASTSGGVVDTIHFTDTTLYNNNLQGALIDNAGGNVANIELNNCRVAGNSSSSVGAYAGVEFAGVAGFAVRGTRSGAHAGFAASQSWGILINTGCDQYDISDCNVIGNITGGFSDLSINTSVSRNVELKLGVLTKNSGIVTIPAGATDVTVTHGLFKAPNVVIASPYSTNLGGTSFWWGTVTSTTFKVNIGAVKATDSLFSWNAYTYGV